MSQGDALSPVQMVALSEGLTEPIPPSPASLLHRAVITGEGRYESRPEAPREAGEAGLCQGGEEPGTAAWP